MKYCATGAGSAEHDADMRGLQIDNQKHYYKRWDSAAGKEQSPKIDITTC